MFCRNVGKTGAYLRSILIQLQTIHPCLVESSLLLPTLVEADDVAVRRQELMLPHLLQLGVSVTVAFIRLLGFLYCV